MTDAPDVPKPLKNGRTKLRSLSNVIPLTEKKKKTNGPALPPDEPVSDGDIASPMLSDDYIALRFAKAHKDDVRYVAQWGKWFLWNGTHWQEDRIIQAFDLVRDVCREIELKVEKHAERKKIASAATIAAVERVAKAGGRLGLSIDAWDCELCVFNDPVDTE